ncbi:hypothetical protein pipiens_001011, partial [Culex pipiens pipiens]
MTDPKTGEQIPIELAYERGLITKSQLPSPERAALQKKLSVDSRRSSEGLVTITVSGDRAPFMLQRMRKCVLRPKDAAEKGIIDQETANALEDPKLFEGNNASLERVIAAGRLDGNRGKIVDPQRGHTLTVNEAIRRGILDRHGTNNLFIPLAKSLAVPELKSQGLLNAADSKIFHPESGQLLSLREALICEIVDPLTEVTVEGKKQTLEQAIEAGVVDDDNNTINGVKLFDAIEGNVFVAPNYSPKIPPVGMTIPVIVKRNLLDTDRKQITHPITKQPMDVNSAIKNDFVMAVPYTPNMDAVQINDALDRKLIITANESYKNPRTSEEIPLQEAIETGLLEVKPLPELVQGMQANTAVMSVTESVSSYHTITTKTVEIQSGFAMISATEVQDTNTGAIMSVDEARQKGILSDAVDSERQVLTEEVNINFTDALQRGLLNVSKGTFTHPTSGDVMSISDAVDRGFIATRNASDEALNRSPEMTHKVISTVQITGPKSSSVERTIPISQVGSSSDPKGESKLGENIKDAAKLGLMAVVGAPVLGGMAIASGVKKLFEKKESEQSETVVTHSGGSVVESTSNKDNTNDKPTIPAVASEHKLPVTDSKKDIDEDPSNLKKSASQKPEDNSVKSSAQDTDNGNDTGKKILDAAKLGLMAVVGAPILAGKAVVDALKKDGSSTQEPADDSKHSVTESRTDQEQSKPLVKGIEESKPLKQKDNSVAPKDKPDQVVAASEPTAIDEKVVEKQQVVKQEPTSGTSEVAQVVDSKAEHESPKIADVVDNEPIQYNDQNSADPIKKDLMEETHEVTEPRPDQAQKVEDHTTETHDRQVDPISHSGHLDTVEQSTQPKDNELVKSDDQQSSAQDLEKTATFEVAEPSPDQVLKVEETEHREVDPAFASIASDNVEQSTKPKNNEPATSDDQHSTAQDLEKVTPDQVQKVEDLTSSSDLQKQAIPPTEAQKAQDHHFDQVAVPATSGTAERPTQLEPTGKESSSNDTGKKILDAAKLGLMAVVGAPILAGKAVVDALKKDHSTEDAPLQVVASPGDGRREFKELEQTIGEILDREDDGKLRTPEKHVTFDIEESQGPTDVQYERMPLGEAISQGKILPKQCKVLVDDKEMP